MKKKILLILALSLTLSACSKEEYVSQRHPEESQISNKVSTEVTFKKKNETNENFSSNNLASLKNLDEKNKSNETEDKKETKEEKKDKKNKKEKDKKPKQAYGIFTVKDISNIRRQTNTDSEIVATIQPGTQIERSEIVGEWSKVSYGEYQGYILTELLDDIE